MNKMNVTWLTIFSILLYFRIGYAQNEKVIKGNLILTSYNIDSSDSRDQGILSNPAYKEDKNDGRIGLQRATLPLYHKTIIRDFGTLLSGSQDNGVYNSYGAINTDKGEAEISAVFLWNSSVKQKGPKRNNLLYPDDHLKKPVGLAYFNVKGALADNTVELFKNGNIVPQLNARLGMNWLLSARYYYYEVEGEKTKFKVFENNYYIGYQCDSSIKAMKAIVSKRPKEKEDYLKIIKLYNEYSNREGIITSDTLQKRILKIFNSTYDQNSDDSLANELQYLIEDSYKNTKEKQTTEIVGSLKNSYREFHWINTEGEFYGENYQLFNPDDPTPRFYDEFFSGGSFKLKYNVHTLHNYKPLKNHFISIYGMVSYGNNRKSLEMYAVTNTYIDTLGGADTLKEVTRKGSAYSTNEIKKYWLFTPGIDWLWYLSSDRKIALNLFTSFDITLTQQLRPSVTNDFDKSVQWNFGGGITFNLPNKDKTKPAVDIGVFASIRDASAPISTEAPYTQRVFVGIKTAIPFVTFKQ